MSNVTLDLETWYLMVYGGVLLAIVTSGLLFRGQSLSTYPVIRHFLQFWRRGICILARTYRKHLAYPFLVPRTGRAKGITRLEGVVALLILLSNILALSVPSIAPTDLSTRAGLLAMTNLVFVLVSPLSLAASILHVSYRVQRRLHLSCGWVVLIVLLIHVVPAMMHGQVDLKDSRLSIGVYAAAAIAVQVLGSLPFLRRLSYEVFLTIHRAVPASVPIALWFHCEGKSSSVQRTLYAAFAVWGLSILYWACRFAYRNGLFGRELTSATFQRKDNAVCVEISVPRSWNIRPGQYVYLTVLTASLTSFLQRHPFMVCTWGQDDDSTGRMKISMIVEKRGNFSDAISKMTERLHHVFIDGPYGWAPDLNCFDYAVLVATGIGFVNYISYLRAFNDYDRLIGLRVIWIMEKDSQLQWVKPYMDSLGITDSTKDLFVTVFGPDARDDQTFGKNLTISKVERDNVHNEIVAQIDRAAKSPRALVAVSADFTLSNFVRTAVLHRLTDGLQFHELDFSPASYHAVAVGPVALGA